MKISDDKDDCCDTLNSILCCKLQLLDLIVLFKYMYHFVRKSISMLTRFALHKLN